MSDGSEQQFPPRCDAQRHNGGCLTRIEDAKTIDYLDRLQATFQTGIGLARLELSGVSPDPAEAMRHLNNAVAKSDELRRVFRDA